MQHHFKQLLTVKETAEYLSISPRTIYGRITRKADKRFPVKPVRVGGSVRFDIDDLRAYVESLKQSDTEE